MDVDPLHLEAAFLAPRRDMHLDAMSYEEAAEGVKRFAHAARADIYLGLALIRTMLDLSQVHSDRWATRLLVAEGRNEAVDPKRISRGRTVRCDREQRDARLVALEDRASGLDNSFRGKAV